MIINITDLEKTQNPLFPPSVSTLSQVNFSQRSPGSNDLVPWFPPNWNFIYEDGKTIPVKPPVPVQNNISMVFAPDPASGSPFFLTADPTGTMYVNLTFELNPPSQFLNNTLTTPFDYNYNPANVTQPALNDAVMEVAVW
jgi:hypothetical protein